ncbi:unnamed protein product, partial [Mesorhabditis belari]|uniref:Fungal lipase-like domain-containing protein n=1 Tax=Mesorhabditis belari TaxID=2138241 RepID=A0AAF3FPY7_9BILA
MWLSLGVSALVSVALAMPFDVKEQIQPITLTAYDDNFARNSMLPLSGAAYSKNPQQCLTNVFKGTLKRQIEVKCDGFKGDTCSGFTAVLPTQKAIVISFRGTDAFLQLIEEVDDGLWKAKVPFPAGGNVNLYFYNAFLDVWNGGMKDDFLSLKNQYPGYALWVTGHSLGAAMASLCAGYIVSVGYYDKNAVKLVTVGQPRIGDSTWAKWHDANVPYSVRVVHSHDVVPHLPLEDMGYSHHMTEVFFKGDMKTSSSFVVCEADESKSCSDGNLTDLSITDHLHYYEHDVSGYGEAGCTGNKVEEKKEQKQEVLKSKGQLNARKLIEAIRRKVHLKNNKH